MSYSFNHKSESGVVGTGSYIFRHYSSGRPLSTSLYYKFVKNSSNSLDTSHTMYLRNNYAAGYTDATSALDGSSIP